jgi:hypothetical protein
VASKNTPALYLGSLVSLLTSTRALGPAIRTREGMDPYSVELDFGVTDPASVQATLAWAREQAPYADVEMASPIQPGVPVSVFARIDLVRLADYLVQRVLLQENAETGQTATGALPKLARKAIDETVGAGGAWASLINRLRLDQSNALAFLRLIESDVMSGPVAAVIQEGISQTVGSDPAWPAFLDGLRSQAALLERITRAVETGEYLKP